MKLIEGPICTDSAENLGDLSADTKGLWGQNHEGGEQQGNVS